MKTYTIGDYEFIVLMDSKCKCIYAIKDKKLCGWLDFDGFFYNRTMYVSGINILNNDDNGLISKMAKVLEKVYLWLYDGFSIEVTVVNPKIKTMIKRIKRLKMFNDAKWITKTKTTLGFEKLVFDMLTDQKIKILKDYELIE